MARDPFLQAARAQIRRLGRHTPAVVTNEGGEQSEIPAVWVNSERTGSIRRTGEGSGGRDFKATAKRLRVLSEQVEEVNGEWRVDIGGAQYFVADHDHDDGGTTILYLAPVSEPLDPESEGNVWR